MTPPTDQTNESLRKELRGLLFGIRRSARYHLRRRRFFELVDTWAQFLQVAFGSTGIVSLLAEFDARITVVAVAVVALSATFNLVIGTSRMARLHQDLARRFLALEKAMVLDSPSSHDGFLQFTAQRLEIEMEEPPVLRTLDRLCHNELLRATGYDDIQMVSIPFYQRLFANLISFDPPKLHTDLS